MRKVGVIFILAVFLPSLGLAWLALKSISAQQLVLERQQQFIHEQAGEKVAADCRERILALQDEFGRVVESLLQQTNEAQLAAAFHRTLTSQWKPAEVGFALALPQTILSPTLFDSPETRRFRLDNDAFLTSRESVEVSWQAGKENKPVEKEKSKTRTDSLTEAQFRFLLGDSQQGMVARFLQDQLKLFLWYRRTRTSELIFGAQLKLNQVIEQLQPALQPGPSWPDQVAVVLLDDNQRVVGGSDPKFAMGRATASARARIGELLPHWEVAVYSRNPSSLGAEASLLRSTIVLLVAVLLVAIGVGSWLIARDLGRQLRLARQKADFVSQVSHEFKTPLTSIRMFSELLQETSPAVEAEKAKSYARIIHQESGRLSRLIHQVLDFAARERGVMARPFQKIDLVPMLQEVAETVRALWEKSGWKLAANLSVPEAWVMGDRDGLAQLLMNLLSNAEKYAAAKGEVVMELKSDSGNWLISVLDRGPGVPAGLEEKVFEEFVRGDDSLSAGIPGSGLGLTLARQVARAHGGELSYQPRPGGGSVFVVRLPKASPGSVS